jgi:hypothetical protein
MARTTYYVALAVARSDDGSLAAEVGIECPNPKAAVGRARGLAAQAKTGAVAYSRTGEPELGEFDPAVVLATFGEVPDDLSEL